MKLKDRAAQALRLEACGTIEQVEAYENDTGDAFSLTLDCLWDEAERAGEYKLAKKLERAFNRLTGVTA